MSVVPVKVCIRVRPSLKDSCINIDNYNTISICCPRTPSNKLHFKYVMSDSNNRFDRVFNSEGTQQMIFDALAEDFDACLNGRNLTIFGIDYLISSFSIRAIRLREDTHNQWIKD